MGWIILFSTIVVFLVAKIYFKSNFIIYFTLASLVIGTACFYFATQQTFLKELVTITALNEKGENSNANANEIVLEKITNEGKIIKPRLVEGKWIFIANTLVWRPIEDIRQPEGVTPSINLEVPVGKQRAIHFLFNGWQGKVQIASDNNTDIVDTSKETVFLLPPSTNELLQKNKMLQGLLGIVTYGLLLSFAFVALYKIQRNKKGCRLWLGEQYDKFIYIGLALLTGIVMFKFALQPAFWNDEILQLGIVYNDNSSIFDAIKNILVNCVNGIDLSPPLYGILAAVWLRIMPYGQDWLYLLNIVLVGVGIYFIGLTASKIMNKTAGIVSCVFAAGSCSMLLTTCYEFRSYALLFFSCALLLYTYTKRIRHVGEEKLSDIIKMGLAISLVIFSHYHGAILCFALFLFDVVCFIRKKIKLKCIISYIIAGVLFLPWIVVVILSASQVLAEQSWQMKPSLINVVNLYMQHLGDGKWFVLLLICCFVLVITAVGNKKYAILKIGLLILLVVPVFLITFYGNFINPQGTGFMYRYFTGLFPVVFLILGIGVAQIIDLVKSQLTIEGYKIKKYMAVALSAGVLVAILMPTYQIISVDKSGGGLMQPFNEMAEHLLNQNDTYSPEVATVWLIKEQLEGMRYFITHKGELDAPKFLWIYDFINQKEQYNKIYISTMHTSFPENLKTEIEKEFIMTGFNEYFTMYTYERIME